MCKRSRAAGATTEVANNGCLVPLLSTPARQSSPYEKHLSRFQAAASSPVDAREPVWDRRWWVFVCLLWLVDTAVFCLLVAAVFIRCAVTCGCCTSPTPPSSGRGLSCATATTPASSSTPA
eukprot:5240766-Pleurochrysis_carterae.AAC.1